MPQGSSNNTTIRIQTYGPRGRSGSIRASGSGWTQIKGTSWSLSPGSCSTDQGRFSR